MTPYRWSIRSVNSESCGKDRSTRTHIHIKHHPQAREHDWMQNTSRALILAQTKKQRGPARLFPFRSLPTSNYYLPNTFSPSWLFPLRSMLISLLLHKSQNNSTVQVTSCHVLFQSNRLPLQAKTIQTRSILCDMASTLSNMILFYSPDSLLPEHNYGHHRSSFFNQR